MSIKTFILCITIPIVSFAYNWENSPNASPSQNEPATQQTEYDQNAGRETPTENKPEPTKKHSISVGYGILTLSDFVGLIGSAIISIFGEDDSFGTLGALSVDYGYKVNEIFETGLVFNYAMPLKNEQLYTIMPRAKLNFNVNGFFNPVMELDGGIAFNGNGAAPIFHATLLGLEMGRDTPIILNLLSFGQRGIFYASFGFRF